MDNFVLALGAATAVTLLIRLLPFVLVRFMILPYRLQLFLKYVPLAMMTALFLHAIWSREHGLDVMGILFIIPALIYGWWRQSLTGVVVISVGLMALWRSFGG
jgi:branched-subunit amino acid transport protein